MARISVHSGDAGVLQFFRLSLRLRTLMRYALQLVDDLIDDPIGAVRGQMIVIEIQWHAA